MSKTRGGDTISKIFPELQRLHEPREGRQIPWPSTR